MFDRKKAKQLRLDRGLDPRELGKLVGAGERTIWRYESGESEPQFSVAERIADVLGVSLDDLRAQEHDAPISTSNGSATTTITPPLATSAIS